MNVERAQHALGTSEIETYYFYIGYIVSISYYTHQITHIEENKADFADVEKSAKSLMLNKLNSYHLERREMNRYFFDEMKSNYAFIDWVFRAGEIVLAVLQILFILITACIVKKLVSISNGIYNSLTNLNEIDIKERTK